MNKRHGILWYFTIFPFIMPFYIVYYLFVFSAYLILYTIQLPFRIFQVCFNQILKALKISTKHSNKVDNGIEYEQFCADYLNHHGYRDAKTTKASGDHGVDVVAYKRGKKYAVQCKYYSSPVGNKAIQEVYTGMALYNCDYGIVITNSTFTKQAKDEAAKLSIKLMPMIEPQGKLFPLKTIIAFIAFALFLAYPKEAFIIFSIIIFIILTVYLVRKLYHQTKSTVSEQTEEILPYDYEDASSSNFEIDPTLSCRDYSPNTNSGFPDIDAILEKNLEKNNSKYENKKPNSIPHSELSYDDLERYMIMCNAQLEHEDEMNQYK